MPFGSVGMDEAHGLLSIFGGDGSTGRQVMQARAWASGSHLSGGAQQALGPGYFGDRCKNPVAQPVLRQRR